MKYFAYGSNMDAGHLERDAHIIPTGRVHAILKGYSLQFNKVAYANPKIGWSNIMSADPESLVHGILYEVTLQDRDSLDEKERIKLNHYYRTDKQVILDNGSIVTAFVYIAYPKRVKQGLKPTKEYLNHLLAGCDLLPVDYCQKLKSIETFD